MSKFLQWVTLSAASLVLAGCASQPQSSAPVQTAPTLSSSAAQYLAQSQQTSSTQASQQQVLASQQMIVDGDISGAKQQLAQLRQQPLSAHQQNELKLTTAQLFLAEGKPYEAIKVLHKIHKLWLGSKTFQLNYYQTAAHAYARNNQLAASIIMRLRSQALQYDASQLVPIWQALQNLPTKSLNILQQQHNGDKYLSGWIQLALIARENSNNNQAIVTALQAWQQQFPNHPAMQLIPDSNILAQITETQSPKRIAVLLPTSGKFASMGHAIENGLLQAYFQTPAKQRPLLRFYNTADGNSINDTYQNAIANGAQIIIGPLTKDNVNALIGNTSVPTIALNYFSDEKPDNLIAFGLSANQEAGQAAAHAWQYGVNKALSITPKSPWGDTMYNGFAQKLQALGGIVLNKLSFTNVNLRYQIQAILNVNQSQMRQQAIAAIVNRPVKFKPRRRQDVNGIFLAATATQAREVLPLLHFYYAGNIPVFATSLVYRGYALPKTDRDLNGLYFCDVPLIISTEPKYIMLRKKLHNIWPKEFYGLARLYGLGIDSFHLAMTYSRLALLPNFGIDGVTGRLYLGANGSVYRQLDWAKIENGKPVLIS